MNAIRQVFAVLRGPRQDQRHLGPTRELVENVVQVQTTSAVERPGLSRGDHQHTHHCEPFWSHFAHPTTGSVAPTFGDRRPAQRSTADRTCSTEMSSMQLGDLSQRRA